MKRELKVHICFDCANMFTRYRKAHPDEKGTESAGFAIEASLVMYRKAHPDEKGTERRNPLRGF